MHACASMFITAKLSNGICSVGDGTFRVNNKYHYCQKSSKCTPLIAQLNSSQVNKLKVKVGVGQNIEPGVWTFHRWPIGNSEMECGRMSLTS